MKTNDVKQHLKNYNRKTSQMTYTEKIYIS